MVVSSFYSTMLYLFKNMFDMNTMNRARVIVLEFNVTAITLYRVISHWFVKRVQRKTAKQDPTLKTIWHWLWQANINYLTSVHAGNKTREIGNE